MTKARDAKETKGDDDRSPSEAHTLFYSPYYDVPSDLGVPAGAALDRRHRAQRGAEFDAWVLAKEDVSLSDQCV